MRLEKEQLIHDLLDDEGRREAALHEATTVLRRRRRLRIAGRAFALVLLATATVLLVEQNRPRHNLAQFSASKEKPAAQPLGQSLTDEQLLSLFPNTPVGLATLPNGKKLLIFPRPADEARYVTRL